MRPAANLELSLRASKPLNPANCSPAALCWRGRSKFGGGERQRNRISPVVIRILCGLEDIADRLNPHGGGIGARFRRYLIFRVAHRNEEVMRESLPLAGPRSALAGLLVLA
jgi:hypothetical protein